MASVQWQLHHTPPPPMCTDTRGVFITCTHTGCAPRKATQWARVSWRTSSSAEHQSENDKSQQLFHSLYKDRCSRHSGTDTSMVSVCVSVGTHSRASSEQQPPHLLTDTQEGIKRWWVSSGNSRHTSTRVSRGSHPLLEYTSNHRRTGRWTKHETFKNSRVKML